MRKRDFEIEEISLDSFDSQLMDLAALLKVCVADGASVNFVLPFSLNDSHEFWTAKVRPGLTAGLRILLTARSGGHLAGAVQLDCDTPPNQPHRAEAAKLLVHPEYRRRGIGRALMIELERHAKKLGRLLITLDTADDRAEALYLSLGYERAGAIPAYAKNPIEDRYDTTTIMFKSI